MFEFTNKKPSSAKIWEELAKTKMPEASSLPDDLMRTMLWILFTAGSDFKQSKDTTNKVLDGTITIDRFRQNFRNALLHSKESAPLDVNPTGVTLPSDLSMVNVYNNEGLELPIAIFKDIFIECQAPAVVAMAKRVFPTVSSEMVVDLTTDIKVAKGNFERLTPYSVDRMDVNTLNSNLRTFVRRPENPETDMTIVPVKSLDGLYAAIKTLLTAAVQKDPDTNHITDVKFILEGDNCEA